MEFCIVLVMELVIFIRSHAALPVRVMPELVYGFALHLVQGVFMDLNTLFQAVTIVVYVLMLLFERYVSMDFRVPASRALTRC